MKPTGNASHAFSSLTLLLSAGLFSLAGCSSTQAAQQGTGGSGFADTTAQSGEAVAQAPECHQTDSTVSCCLKQHPGDYERCGATPPTQKPNQPNRLPHPERLRTSLRTRRSACGGKSFAATTTPAAFNKGGKTSNVGSGDPLNVNRVGRSARKLDTGPRNGTVNHVPEVTGEQLA